MSMFRTVFSLSLISASLAFAGWTQQGDASASFDAKGPAGFKIHGEAKKLAVVDDGKALTVNLTLKDIDTDNALRNKHMFEDIGAEQFPLMSLSVPLDALKSADGANTAEATGTVTLHGQTEQVPSSTPRPARPARAPSRAARTSTSATTASRSARTSASP